MHSLAVIKHFGDSATVMRRGAREGAATGTFRFPGYRKTSQRRHDANTLGVGHRVRHVVISTISGFGFLGLLYMLLKLQTRTEDNRN